MNNNSFTSLLSRIQHYDNENGISKATSHHSAVAVREVEMKKALDAANVLGRVAVKELTQEEMLLVSGGKGFSTSPGGFGGSW